MMLGAGGCRSKRQSVAAAQLSVDCKSPSDSPALQTAVALPAVVAAPLSQGRIALPQTSDFALSKKLIAQARQAMQKSDACACGAIGCLAHCRMRNVQFRHEHQGVSILHPGGCATFVGIHDVLPDNSINASDV